MLIENVVCPISNVKIDGNVSRLTAFFISLLIALYLLTGVPFFIVAAALDLSTRAVGKSRYSPIVRIAAQLTGGLKLPKKQIDQAPKIFASRLGVICASLSALFSFTLFPAASFAVAGVLLTFTLLDSLANFCVGCLIYHHLVLPFYHHG